MAAIAAGFVEWNHSNPPFMPGRARAFDVLTTFGGGGDGAGIVLAAVFAVLGVLPLILLTQLGIVVGLGILLDTFVVRTVVIPTLFTLVGPRIWWPTTLDPHSEDSHSTTREGVTP